jgi:hypothetical protein
MDLHVNHHDHTYRNVSIKTASDLKYWHELLNPDSYFFERKTMRFFGDYMANYGVKHHSAYIELYRRKPVNGGLQSSAYFDIATLDRVFPVES